MYQSSPPPPHFLIPVKMKMKMKMNDKFHDGILTALSTDHYVSIMSFVFSVYESAQYFSFTTSPQFLWFVRLQGCTPSVYVYSEVNLYKSHNRFENFLSESVAVFIFCPLCYCRKGQNKFEIPTGVCTTMNVLRTL
jgi:hypothetical protein